VPEIRPAHGASIAPGDDKSDGDSASDTISSFGTEAFAKAISKGGGFGIARQVISQVELEHQKNSEKKIPGY
jgi:flagellar protein FlgJ